MAGRRFFQRGHASLSTPRHLSSATPQRFALLLAGLSAAGVGLVLFSSYAHNDVSESSLDAMAATRSSSASKATVLVEQAMAVVRDDSALPLSSGLVPRTLSREALAESRPLVGQAEARLIHIYQLISQADHRQALQEAESLVADHPNFHLANLVLGDLLSASIRPIRQLGDVPDTTALAASKQLEVLREQSRLRLMALTERPPEGSIPSQFLSLSTQSQHAIAVDASRSRLYLFENKSSNDSPLQMTLVGDYYISVGQLGVDKTTEGDLRTPLGIYYITSNLDAAKLPDLYGAGALPLNYPNALDNQRGKTGSGIWLHGSPSAQFARPPLASEGCVVLSNQDLETLLEKVQIRTTPVVIAPELKWVMPDALNSERNQFNEALEAWRTTKSRGDLAQLRSFYSANFNNQGQKLTDWWPRVEGEVRTLKSSDLQIKDLSVLNWQDKDDTMVVTFGEIPVGKAHGVTKRQYWIREGKEWKIFNEGTV